jgi:hypothetical protein
MNIDAFVLILTLGFILFSWSSAGDEAREQGVDREMKWRGK